MSQLPSDRPLPPGCDPNDAKVSCHGRNHAIRRGHFFFDFNLDAWVFAPSEQPRRNGSTHAKLHDLNENDDEPYRYSCCPWCGRDLPSGEKVKEAIERDHAVDANEEESDGS